RRRAERVVDDDVGSLGADFVGDRRAAPRDSQAADVVLVDLIERGVLRVALVAAVVAPFTAAAGAALRGDVRGPGDQHGSDERRELAPVHGGSFRWRSGAHDTRRSESGRGACPSAIERTNANTEG